MVAAFMLLYDYAKRTIPSKVAKVVVFYFALMYTIISINRVIVAFAEKKGKWDWWCPLFCGPCSTSFIQSQYSNEL